MQLPKTVQEIIGNELDHLANRQDFDLHPSRRLEIYHALGPSSVPDSEAWIQRVKDEQLPQLTTTDRVRTRIALLTAEKVIPLWETACQETDSTFGTSQDVEEEERQLEQRYLSQRGQRQIEEISAYDVPRILTPAHIMEMATLVLRGEIQDFQAFKHQANEWWGIYGDWEGMEREFSIKWAAQEALYEALGWNKYFRDAAQATGVENGVVSPHEHTDAPAGHALFAFAGIFDEPSFRFDDNKRREFWHWWLDEAISLAWSEEH